MKNLFASACSAFALVAAMGAAVLPMAAHAAPEEVTYLLPAPPNSPAFAPGCWPSTRAITPMKT
jgi:NitT/TauT family transport system substrate-binding protein